MKILITHSDPDFQKMARKHLVNRNHDVYLLADLTQGDVTLVEDRLPEFDVFILDKDINTAAFLVSAEARQSVGVKKERNIAAFVDNHEIRKQFVSLGIVLTQSHNHFFRTMTQLGL